MPPELLYLVPILAIAVLGYLMAVFLQRRSESRIKSRIDADIASVGTLVAPRRTAAAALPDQSDLRISGIEQKIGTLTNALSDQQRVIDTFQNENNSYANEVNGLKKKLHDLHKEYDLILSENFSLKAKVKTMNASPPSGSPPPMSGGTSHFSVLPPEMEQMTTNDRAALHKRLFEDTRIMKALDVDDTSEIDITDLT